MTDYTPTDDDTDESDEETTQVIANVPVRLKRDAKQQAEYGELSEAIRHALTTLAYGEAAGREREIQFELDSIREKKDQLRGQIRTLQTDLENVERRETRLEERLNDVQSAEDRYEGNLEQIEQQLRDGMSVTEDHGAVKRAAKAGNRSPSEVITDLQERNPELPEDAFSPGGWDDGESDLHFYRDGVNDE